jgi:hypothetical protein
MFFSSFPKRAFKCALSCGPMQNPNVFEESVHQYNGVVLWWGDGGVMVLCGLLVSSLCLCK